MSEEFKDYQSFKIEDIDQLALINPLVKASFSLAKSGALVGSANACSNSW